MIHYTHDMCRLLLCRSHVVAHDFQQACRPWLALQPRQANGHSSLLPLAQAEEATGLAP